MRAKFGFWVMALALLSFFSMAVPQQVWAQDIGSSPKDICEDGKIDKDFQDAASAVGSAISQDMTNAWSSLSKIDVKAMYCINNVIEKFQSIMNMVKGISDPLGAITGMFTSQITQLINQVCGQVMSAVNGLTRTISSLARICIPMPSFNMKLNIGGFKAPKCSGQGISLLGSGAGSSMNMGNSSPLAPKFSNNNWLKQ